MVVADALLITPNLHGDQRGFFESWRQDQYARLGVGPEFVQDNHSRSSRGSFAGPSLPIERPAGQVSAGPGG